LPRRQGAVTPKAPKRSEGAAQPLDGGLAAWPRRTKQRAAEARRRVDDGLGAVKVSFGSLGDGVRQIPTETATTFGRIT